MKSLKRILMTMLAMCWASQSLAQATQPSDTAWVTSYPRYLSIGTCEIIPGVRNVYTEVMEYSGSEYVGNPIMRAEEFIWSQVYKANLKSEAEQLKIRSSMNPMLEQASATLIKPTKHAKYELEKNIRAQGFSYEPKEGYIGKDSFTYLVKYGPYTVKVNSYVHAGVPNPWGDGDRPDIDRRNIEKICGNKRGTVWRMASVPTNDATFIVSEFDISSDDFTGYSYLSPTITFHDLSAATVGEATVSVGWGFNPMRKMITMQTPRGSQVTHPT